MLKISRERVWLIIILALMIFILADRFDYINDFRGEVQNYTWAYCYNLIYSNSSKINLTQMVGK